MINVNQGETLIYNINEKDTSFLNDNDYLLFNKKINLNYPLFKESLIEVNIDRTYDFRPDKIAYEFYGNDYYWPLVLKCCNIGSPMEFTTNNLGNTIKLLHQDLIEKFKEI